MTGTMATAARRMLNSVFINRSSFSDTTARRQRTGGTNATRRTKNWSAVAAASGESVNGANMNGGSTAAITMVIVTIATETAIEIVTATTTATKPRQQFARRKTERGAPESIGTPRSGFAMKSRISAKSPTAHRKKQLRSGESHPGHATSRWERRANTACRHGTA